MMKALTATVGVVVLMGCVSVRDTEVRIDDHSSHKCFRHVVLFKFKDSATQEQQDAVVREFLALKSKIDVITSVEGGRDASTENLQQGFTHCFIVTFADSAGRDIYLPHPKHKEFVAFLQPYLDKALVVDFAPAR